MILQKAFKAVLTFLGLGFLCWGLWGYDPRLAMISGGVGLFLMGIGKL